MLEKIIIKHNNEDLVNVKISSEERLILLVNQSYRLPETLLYRIVKGIKDLVNYYCWENLLEILNEILNGELDVTLYFKYKKDQVSYYFSFLDSNCMFESAFLNEKPVYMFEKNIGKLYKLEEFENYNKISKVKDLGFSFNNSSNIRHMDSLFYQLINSIVTEEKMIHEYDDRVKKIYEKLIPKLDLGITRVFVGKCGADYYVGEEGNMRMSLSDLGSGMNTLANSLPKAIDAIIHNKTYFFDFDGLSSIHPVLSQYLIMAFNQFSRGRVIMPCYSIYTDRPEYYNLKKESILDLDDIINLRSNSPETLIFE